MLRVTAVSPKLGALAAACCLFLLSACHQTDQPTAPRYGVSRSLSTGLGSQITPGDLLFPDAGLNAIQEFNPSTRQVVHTWPLPAPFTYAYPWMLLTALVDQSHHDILTNARDAGGGPVVLVLNSFGQYVTSQQAGSGYFLQQLIFDPTDPRQQTVLGGIPFEPAINAINPFADSVMVKVLQNGNWIGLASCQNQLFAGDFGSGFVYRYLDTAPYLEASLVGVFANVIAASRSNEIDGMAFGQPSPSGSTGCAPPRPDLPAPSFPNLYVTQVGGNRVLEFDSIGRYVTSFTGGGLNHPGEIFSNPEDGLLYVGNQGDDGLVIMRQDGTQVAVVHLGGSVIGTGALVPNSGYSPSPPGTPPGLGNRTICNAFRTSPGWVTVAVADSTCNVGPAQYFYRTIEYLGRDTTGSTVKTCAVDPIPSGWVGIAWPGTCFDAFGSTLYYKTIQKVEGMPPGSTANMCSIDQAPTGWVEVGWPGSGPCATTGGVSMWERTIENIAGLPRGSIVNLCGVDPVPPGWRLVKTGGQCATEFGTTYDYREIRRL